MNLQIPLVQSSSGYHDNSYHKVHARVSHMTAIYMFIKDIMIIARQKWVG